jgi:uncharacterized protein (DUF2141 family)
MIKISSILKPVALMLFSLCAVFTLTSVVSSDQKVDLTVVITNINIAKGKIQIGLYNKKDTYPIPGREYKVIYVKVDQKEFKHTIKDLPAGEYAIALYHDKNSDGECNKNLIGVPTESYGFSNNVKPFLSAPSFGETKFKLYKNSSIYIKLFH